MPQVAHILGWGGLSWLPLVYLSKLIYISFEGSQTLKSPYSFWFLQKSSFWAQAPVPMPGPDPGPGRERENSHQGCGERELAQQALGRMDQGRRGVWEWQFTMVGGLCEWYGGGGAAMASFLRGSSLHSCFWGAGLPCLAIENLLEALGCHGSIP